MKSRARHAATAVVPDPLIPLIQTLARFAACEAFTARPDLKQETSNAEPGHSDET